MQIQAQTLKVQEKNQGQQLDHPIWKLKSWSESTLNLKSKHYSNGSHSLTFFFIQSSKQRMINKDEKAKETKKSYFLFTYGLRNLQINYRKQY